MEEQIFESIKVLNEKGGSSRHAIKKYIANNNPKFDDAIELSINSTIKKCVQNGTLCQLRGPSGCISLPKTLGKNKIANELVFIPEEEYDFTRCWLINCHVTNGYITLFPKIFFHLS